MKLNRRSNRGAALVEFAVIMPIFILMIFGMIEASWAFASANDIRHGAREGARLAAVNWDDGTNTGMAAIGPEVCNRMDMAGGTGVVVALAAADGYSSDSGGRGSTARITVTLSYKSLTGALDQWFGGKTLSSDIDFVVEQPIDGSATDWWNSGSGSSYSCQ